MDFNNFPIFSKCFFSLAGWETLIIIFFHVQLTSSIFHPPCVSRMLSRLSFKILFVYAIFVVNSVFFCFPLFCKNQFFCFNTFFQIFIHPCFFLLWYRFCSIDSWFHHKFPSKRRVFYFEQIPCILVAVSFCLIVIRFLFLPLKKIILNPILFHGLHNCIPTASTQLKYSLSSL